MRLAWRGRFGRDVAFAIGQTGDRGLVTGSGFLFCGDQEEGEMRHLGPVCGP